MDKLARKVVRVCPKAFQDRLTKVGGRNRYGQPRFFIVWAQNSFKRYAGLDGKYHSMPTDFGEPCWVIKMWHRPEEYGTAFQWYLENRDPVSGLSLQGSYPYKGKYETLFQLKWKAVQNGRLNVKYVPLTNDIMTMIVPLIRKAQSDSFWKQQQVIKEADERREKAEADRLADRMWDARPAYMGPISYGRQKETATSLQKRMAFLEKEWDRLMARATHMRSQGSNFVK